MIDKEQVKAFLKETISGNSISFTSTRLVFLLFLRTTSSLFFLKKLKKVFSWVFSIAQTERFDNIIAIITVLKTLLLIIKNIKPLFTLHYSKRKKIKNVYKLKNKFTI